MSYVDEVLAMIRMKSADEPEFLQTVTEIVESLRPIFDANEEKYRKEKTLERLLEPEQSSYFRVVWTDDKGETQVNRGWRVHFNSALGPYKGGIRFAPEVNLGTLKFLAFEQTFKNALTGLSIGGGKGGSDFDPQGKSEAELMRFCQAFAEGMLPSVGADLDCPAGDLGCGTKEMGYMFGRIKKLTGRYEAGALSGKPLSSGGSLGRDTATGHGATYFTEELLESVGKTVKGTKFCISGFGNVAWGVAKKVSELGGIVVAISGPDGYVYDPAGIKEEKVEYMLEMRASRRNRVQDYADKFGVEFFPGQKPWGRVGAEVYMPCAMQNEIHTEDAERMNAEGTSKILVEVSNMPTTLEAIEYLKKNGWIIAPSKAVNAGGVAVSAMEMSQNASKLAWTAEEVEDKLKPIMQNIFHMCNVAAAKYGMPGDLIAGANLAAAERILEAMEDQGIN